jgi:MYXO-CTERM domain-containing protein
MRRLLLFCLASAGLASAARATVLDFEGLPLSSTSEGWLAPIPNGYGGFQWDSLFTVMDATTFVGNPSGYLSGRVSGNNVAFNGYAEEVGFWLASGTFTLNSLYLTGAWNNNLNIEIKGYSGGSQLYSTTVVVSATEPTHVVLDWSGLDRATFRSYGGVGYWAPINHATHFVLDDLRVNEPTGVPVPEPFTVALGLGGLALAARRRRR